MTDPQQNARVTVSEIAQLAAVSVSAVSNWRKRYVDFPAPVEGTAAGDFFALNDVVVWLERRGKKVRAPKSVGLNELLWSVADALRGEGAANESLLLAVLQVLTVWRFSMKLNARAESGESALWSGLRGASEDQLPAAWRHAVESLPVGDNQAVREVLSAPSVSWRAVRQVLVAVDRLASEGMRDATSRVFGEAVSLVIAQMQDSQAIRVFGSSTPRSLTSLIVQLLTPVRGLVYDPAAGHAMALAEAARVVASEDIQLVGQEIAEYSWRVGVLHLALCGFEATLNRGDTLLHDAFRGRVADRIILDPPFNTRLTSTDIVFDPRWKYGTSNVADWMWAQHLVQHLAPNGIGVMVVPMGSLSRSGRDAMIRARLIEAGELDAVIALPPGLVAGTNVSIALLLFDRTRVGIRGDVLFVDARQLGMSRRGLVSDLTPEAITRITDAVRAWRLGQPVSEPTFAAVASTSEILGGTTAAGGQEAHADLTPNRYIRYVAEADEANAREQLEAIEAALDTSRKALGKTVELKSVVSSATSRLAPVHDEWPSVRLRDVLEERPVVGSRLDPDGLDDERPFVSASFVTGSGGRIDRLPDETTRSKRKVRAARRGDVLLASRGIDASSRRVSCATVDVDSELSYSDSLLLLTPKANLLDPDYLRYTLTSGSGVAALAALSTGTTIASIRPDALMELEIRMPPLEVQRKLVESLSAVEFAGQQLNAAAQHVSALFGLLKDGVAVGQLEPAHSYSDAPVQTPSSTSDNPLNSPIGIYVKGDAVLPGYRWFASEREALDWYFDECVIPALRRTKTWKVLHEVLGLRAWADGLGIGLALVAASMNAETDPAVCLEWVGTFDELRHGMTHRSRYLCAEFWEMKAEGGAIRRRLDPTGNYAEQLAIDDANVGEFIEMIKALNGDL